MLAPFLVAIISLGGYVALAGRTQLTREAGPALERADRLIARAGLGLDRVEITGLRNARDTLIFAALDEDPRRSLVLFDSRSARERIEQISWVRSVELTRRWPNTLAVAIVEREPVAIWRHQGQDHLLDTDGRVLGEVGTGAVGSLMVLKGAGAGDEIAGLRALLVRHRTLTEQVVAARWIDGRRWTLELTRGRLVHLPAVEPASSLDMALAGPDGQRLIDIDFDELDLRAAGRVLVRRGRPTSAAALVPHAQPQATGVRAGGRG